MILVESIFIEIKKFLLSRSAGALIFDQYLFNTNCFFVVKKFNFCFDLSCVHQSSSRELSAAKACR